MLPTIYKVLEIEMGILSVMAKPVSGEWIEEEFLGLKQLGVDKIVSLLEADEQHEVGLSKEKEQCDKNNIEFISFPIADRGLPETQLAIDISKSLYEDIVLGKHVVIHCRAGIGRTGIIAGAVLLQSGFMASTALQKISEARGVRVPDTEEQENWLRSLQL